MADPTPAQILLPVAVCAVPTLALLRWSERWWPRSLALNAAVTVVAVGMSTITLPLLTVPLIVAGVVSGFFSDSERSRRTTIRPVAIVAFLLVATGLTGNTQGDPQFTVHQPIAAAILANAVLATTWLAMTAAWHLGTALPPTRAATSRSAG